METLASPQDGVVVGNKVFLIRPDFSKLSLVINFIRRLPENKSVHLIFLPKVVHGIEGVLEEEGLYGKVNLHSFAWELIPLDHDIFSMEMPWIGSDIFFKGDLTQISAVARCLNGLQALFGPVPNRYAVGKHAAASLEHLKIMEEENLKSGGSGRSEIGHLIVFDRDVDYGSCLLSPMNYEALLDETYGINCGMVELRPELGNVKLPLNSKDKVFRKIRNKMMGPEIFTILSSFAQHLQQIQTKITTASGVSVAEMKRFVQRDLKEVQGQSKAISTHIGALEFIQKEKGPLYEKLQPVETGLLLNTAGCYKEAVAVVEDIICQKYPIQIVLRLWCLTSHCSNGLNSGDFEKLKKMFLQTYGFEKMLAINMLTKIGLLSVKDNSSLASASLKTGKGRQKPTFYQISKKLGLNNDAAAYRESEESTFASISSPAYVFNGSYNPIACRLSQEIVLAGTNVGGFAMVEDRVKELGVKFSRLQASAATSNKLNMEASKMVVVFFIGGYTMAEVAAFRYLQTTTGYHFVIAGTSNVTGSSMMNSILESSL